MAVPVPLIDYLPNQPTVASDVQGWLVSSPIQGTSVTFTLTNTATGTTTTATGTAIVDPSGAAVSPVLAIGVVGQYSLVVTLGTLVLASCAFLVAA